MYIQLIIVKDITAANTSIKWLLLSFKWNVSTENHFQRHVAEQRWPFFCFKTFTRRVANQLTPFLRLEMGGNER